MESDENEEQKPATFGCRFWAGFVVFGPFFVFFYLIWQFLFGRHGYGSNGELLQTNRDPDDPRM